MIVSVSINVSMGVKTRQCEYKCVDGRKNPIAPIHSIGVLQTFMKRRVKKLMAKKDYGLVVGKCEICTINLWDASGGEPAIWPCNIKDCPYETYQEQHAPSQD